MKNLKHLAQLNVATAIDDLDSQSLQGFMGALDAVNAVADRAPGFVWRLQGEDGADATEVKVSDDPLFIINLSVWETPDTLEDFVWNTIHAKIYAQKEKWFEVAKHQHLVMWWVEPGHEPTPEEAMARLEHLHTHGPTDHAFGWESLPGVRLWQSKRCS